MNAIKYSFGLGLTLIVALLAYQLINLGVLYVLAFLAVMMFVAESNFMKSVSGFIVPMKFSVPVVLGIAFLSELMTSVSITF